MLLLAHPRPLTDTQTYAIDQFVMRGGRVIAFVDPHSEVSLTAGPNNEPLRGYTEQSNLPDLMAAWGVRMDDTLIIADRARAQRVAAGRDARRALVDYILWMALSDAEMAQDDLITANIDRLNLGTVGAWSGFRRAHNLHAAGDQFSRCHADGARLCAERADAG